LGKSFDENCTTGQVPAVLLKLNRILGKANAC
jgi:hypothetical protein